jgi:sterol desaturase/sphingolipid hydroxylase (fatty acid hydroxylase superfamily)
MKTAPVLLVLLILSAYAALVEYSVHRWLMHKPLLGRQYWYMNHAIEHHGRGRNDLDIVIWPTTTFALCTPFMAIVWPLTGAWMIGVVIVASGFYSAVWSVLHAAYHDVGWEWVKRLPGYITWREHHLLHHANPAANFGTIFILTDRLFGTRSRLQR